MKGKDPASELFTKLIAAVILIYFLKFFGLFLAFLIFLSFFKRLFTEGLGEVAKPPAPRPGRAEIEGILRRGLILEAPGELIPGSTALLKVGFRNASRYPLTVDVDLRALSRVGRVSQGLLRLRVGPNEGKHVFVRFTPGKAGEFRVPVFASSGGIRVGRELRLVVKAPKGRERPKERSERVFGTLDELLSRYRSVELIGSGGFGRVYRAVRPDGRVVALKVPHSLNERTGRAFLREVSAWLSLKHRNIVELYDANLYPYPHMEMEYCDGSLEKLSVPLSWEEAAEIAFEIAEGLKYAHSKGIIHRDLKPSNILLKGRTPKISDWGLAKLMTETSTTSSAFTPYYAAPEQISRSRFGPTDERTDVWQLGVLLYWLATGRLPFEGEDFIEVAGKITMEEPAPPSEINPESKPVEPVVMRCLAKRKEERYASVAELQRDLAGLLGGKYSRELERSVDFSRSAYYAGQLLLLHLKLGDAKEALKYALSLRRYAKGKAKRDLEGLIRQLEVRISEGLPVPPELVEKAEVVAHEISST
ncbi:serine/threonine-protein kinase [Thermococcus sp.]|uniref:serine/threonine-protein kinase n=1 Tax=Thermococcus sp. TaxID=35749 RepID=UPI002627EFF4|nr:serine/threonine-protein kinase [Thermococcus sp.]